MWSASGVAELQLKWMKQKVEERAQRIIAFADKHLQGTKLGTCFPDPAELQWAVAAAASRAVQASADGKHALVPLVDLVNIAEGPSFEDILTGGEPADPNCELRVEDDGIIVLYAARNIMRDEVLTRAAEENLFSEDLLLRYGLVAGPKPEDRLALNGGVLDGTASSWQLNMITKSLQLRPGRLQGDFFFPGEVRRGGELEEAISESFFFVARVMSCTDEEELEVYVGEPGQEVKVEVSDAVKIHGLIGLSGSRREACIDKLEELLKGCLGDFPTTAEEDVKLLEKLSGVRRIATGFRLQKKRLVQHVLALLESARSGTDEAASSGALPFAVTGLQP